MTCDQLVSIYVGRPDGEKLASTCARINLSSPKVIASPRKWVAKRNASWTQVKHLRWIASPFGEQPKTFGLVLWSKEAPPQKKKSRRSRALDPVFLSRKETWRNSPYSYQTSCPSCVSFLCLRIGSAYCAFGHLFVATFDWLSFWIDHMLLRFSLYSHEKKMATAN